MKTLLTLTVFVFLFQQAALAQQEQSPKNTNQNQAAEAAYQPVQNPVPMNDLYSGGGGYTDVFYLGNPSGMFLNPEWEKGQATLLDGSILEGEFRYNIYLQKMQAVVEGDTFAFAKPCELASLQLGEQKFIYTTFVRGDQEVSNSWFEILCEGDCQLLLRRYIKYRVTDGDDDPTNDQLYRRDDYYSRTDGGALKEIFQTKESVFGLMKDHEKLVKDYMKSEKLKLTDRQDLVQLFAYYNSLD
jgi:hypothetical protein